MTLLVNINDLRALNMCARSARAWFDVQGLSWSEFVATGTDAEVLRATEDPLALRVIAVAEKRNERG